MEGILSPEAPQQQIVQSPVAAVLGRDKSVIYRPAEIRGRTSVKTTLSERSLADVEAFHMLIHNAEEVGSISNIAITYARPIAKRLKELQLRLKIWMEDVDINSGVLKKMEGQNGTGIGPHLYPVIGAAFETLEVNLNDIGDNISNMRGHFLHMKEQG
jgi:hypothetical protein